MNSEHDGYLFKCDIEFEGLVELENRNNAFYEMFVVCGCEASVLSDLIVHRDIDIT